MLPAPIPAERGGWDGQDRNWNDINPDSVKAEKGKAAVFLLIIIPMSRMENTGKELLEEDFSTWHEDIQFLHM